MIHNRAGRLFTLLSLLFIAGCGGRDGPGAKLVPVTGRVTSEGKALPGVEVFFMPDSARGNQGTMATALTQEDGSFTMATNPGGKGVLPGAYKVVLKMGRRPVKALGKYQDVRTTPKTVTVPPEGLNEDIDINKT